MQLITDLLAKPANLSRSSNVTAMNGILYLGAGALLLAVKRPAKTGCPIGGPHVQL